MKFKKVIYVIILAILIVGTLLIYTGFNGNPISNSIGKHVALKYIKETYPDESFTIEDGTYCFPLGEYGYKINKIGEDPFIDSSKGETSLNYSISTSGFLGNHIAYDGIKYARLDENVSDILSTSASSEITILLIDSIPGFKRASARIEVLKGEFSDFPKWTKELTIKSPISISISIDGTDKSKKDILNIGKDVQKILNDNGYIYTNVHLGASRYDKELGGDKSGDGYLKYTISFTPDSSLSIRDVKDHNKGL